MSLQEAAELVPGPGEVVARPVYTGQTRLSSLITHRFPLEAYEEAYQMLRSSSGPRGKVILEVREP